MSEDKERKYLGAGAALKAEEKDYREGEQGERGEFEKEIGGFGKRAREAPRETSSLKKLAGCKKPSCESAGHAGSNFKRASLRKQASSQQLDSCGSSDSGQGTCCHSNGSLAGCSSLGSVTAAVGGEPSSTSTPSPALASSHPANASGAAGSGPSCSPSSSCSSSSSSSSSASSSAMSESGAGSKMVTTSSSASSFGSSSFHSSSCSSSSSSPRTTSSSGPSAREQQVSAGAQHFRQQHSADEEHLRRQRASSSFWCRRRQNWLMSCSLPPAAETALSTPPSCPQQAPQKQELRVSLLASPNSSREELEAHHEDLALDNKQLRAEECNAPANQRDQNNLPPDFTGAAFADGNDYRMGAFAESHQPCEAAGASAYSGANCSRFQVADSAGQRRLDNASRQSERDARDKLLLCLLDAKQTQPERELAREPKQEQQCSGQQTKRVSSLPGCQLLKEEQEEEEEEAEEELEQRKQGRSGGMKINKERKQQTQMIGPKLATTCAGTKAPAFTVASSGSPELWPPPTPLEATGGGSESTASSNPFARAKLAKGASFLCSSSPASSRRSRGSRSPFEDEIRGENLNEFTGPDLGDMENGERKQENEELQMSELVICGKIKMLEYLPMELGGAKNTAGRLLVCLDINEAEERHLIESKLIRHRQRDEREKPDEEDGQNADRWPQDREYKVRNFLNRSLIIAGLHNSPGSLGAPEMKAQADRLADLDTDWLLAGECQLSPISGNSASSSPASSSDSDEGSSERYTRFIGPDREDACAAEASDSSGSLSKGRVSRRKQRRRLQGQQFWRLVASASSACSSSREPSLSSGSEPEPAAATDSRLEEPLEPLPAPRRSRSPEECSLAKLIRAADEDPNNRPRLLLLNRSSGGLCFQSGARQPQQSQPAPASPLSSGSPALSSGKQLKAPSKANAKPNPNAQPQVTPAAANNGAPPRLNSIDEEEVCLTQQLDSESEINFTSRSTSSYSSMSMEALAKSASEDNGHESESELKALKYSSAGPSSSAASSPASSCSRPSAASPGPPSSERPARRDKARPAEGAPEGVRDGSATLGDHNQAPQARSGEPIPDGRAPARDDEIRIDVSGCAPSIKDPEDDEHRRPAKPEQEPQRQPEGEEPKQSDEDDDYFYDDELLFDLASKQRGSLYSNASRRSSGGQRCLLAESDKKRPNWEELRQQRTTGCSSEQPNSGEMLLAELAGSGSVAGSRPLIVWAPTVRRVSCPVGSQLASFSSWRQLWPDQPPGLLAQGQSACEFLCGQCLRMAQRPAGEAFGPDCRSNQRAVSPASSPQNGSQSCTQRERKTSQQSLLTSSDYFSSFDQTTACDQLPSSLVAGNGSSISSATSELISRRHQSGHHLQRATSNRPSLVCQAGSLAAGLSQLELRRQSTITGFDHQRYTAPRSPSLCLPAPPPLSSRRQNLSFGRRLQQPGHSCQNANPNQLEPLGGPGRRLSPSHSTGGSSSPSPTNWYLNQAPNGCHPGQPTGGQLANGYAQPRTGGRFTRARLESLESDRGSSPCSWSASTSSLRSSIGSVNCHPPGLLANLIQTGSKPIQQHQRKLSGCLCADCYPSGLLQANHSKLAARLSSKLQTGPKHQLGHNPATASNFQQQLLQQEQNLQQQQHQNQQAVYFFFCCCQRRQDKRQDSEEPQEDAPAGQAHQPSRRVSLVGRAAIVGAGENSSNANQVVRQQQEATQALTSQPTSSASLLTSDLQQAEPEKGRAEAGELSRQREEAARAASGTQGSGKPEGELSPDASKPTKEHEDQERVEDLLSQLNSLLGRLDQIQSEARLREAGAVSRGDQERRQKMLLAIRQKLAETESLVLGGDQSAEFQVEPTPSGALQIEQPESGGRRANMMRYSTPNLVLSTNFEHILRQCGRRQEDFEQQQRQQREQQEQPPEAVEAWFLSRSPAGSRSPGSGLALAGSGLSQRPLNRQPSSSSASRESLARASKVCLEAGEEKRQLRGPNRRRSTSQQQQQAGAWERAPEGSGAARHSAGQIGRLAGPELARDDGGLAGAQWCQSASSSSAHANEFARGPEASAQKVAGELLSAPNAEEAQSGSPAEDGARVLTVGQERDANPIRAPAAGAATAAATGTSQVGAGSPTVASVHDKSMAQARYLYSTLTSNAGALLPANQSPQASKAAQSPSPTRSHNVQRKQAQFVDRQQRQARRQEHRPASGPQAARLETSESRATPDLSPASQRKSFFPRSSFEESTSSTPRESSRHRKQALASRRAGDSSEGDSGDDSSSDEERAQEAPKPAPSGRRKSSSAREEEATQTSGLATPSIVESQYQEQVRRASRTSSASRSNSVSHEPALQQLQPSSTAMDPAMHALWAQGADLDTGNGNFIVATRRRRSVHAVHQVQLHQQQQQQQARNLLVSGSQQSEAGKCYKIEERSPSGSGSVSSCADSSADLNLQLGASRQRVLRTELWKLRATSSIDEASTCHQESSIRFGAGTQLPSGSFGNQTASKSKSASSFVAALNKEPTTSVPERAEVAEAQERKQHSVEKSEREDKLEPAGRLDSEQPDERFFFLSDAEYDLDELESNSSMLANLYDWNYPIFELADRYGDAILSKLSYRIFFDSGFFESFKIPKQAFFNFFHALEEGYHLKPYHNRLHAADVLHAVYYLTSQPIDNFCQVPLNLIEHYDNLLASTRRPPLEMVDSVMKLKPAPRGTDNLLLADLAIESELASGGDEFLGKLHNHIVAVVVAAAAAAADSELPFGIMGANLTALEVMALYTSAAMHDFQHPGRTNSFLVATSSPLALLYNDRSVLENHHSAAAWALFYSGPNFNWLCNLEKDEFKRFRFMVIELILATDLMRHYELVSAFNKKLNDVGRHNIDWFCESDRLLVMEIIIKLADVNGPMKGHKLHCQWTDRIAMEFYEQGDEERALNLPVSLYMDRSDPRLPELQKSFINHLVGPLSHSYAAAGFFPRSPSLAAAERQHSRSLTSEEEEEEESVYSQSKYWLIEEPQEEVSEGEREQPKQQEAAKLKAENTSLGKQTKLNHHFLQCLQTLNLRSNFLYWDAKSKEPKQAPTISSQLPPESTSGDEKEN